MLNYVVKLTKDATRCSPEDHAKLRDVGFDRGKIDEDAMDGAERQGQLLGNGSHAQRSPPGEQVHDPHRSLNTRHKLPPVPSTG